jgi:cell division protein FtsL
MKSPQLIQDLVLLVLALALAAAAVTLAWVRHESRWQFRELQRLATEERQLRLKRDDLQLIQAAMRNGVAVEEAARGELGLVFPKPEQHEVIAP